MNRAPAFAALALLAFLALAGCGQNAPPPGSAASAQPSCDQVVRRTVAFTAPDAEDALEARAFGPDCRSVFVALTLRRADGKPLWIWASEKPWLQATPQSADDFDGAAAVQQFLNELVKVRIDTTARLPEWPQRTTAFADSLGAFLSTPFQRDQYLDIRNRAAPRLCFASGIAHSQCVYYDSQSGDAVKVLDSGE